MRGYRIAAALVLALTVSSAWGDDVDTYVKKADEAIERRDLAGAAEWLGKAIAADPKNARIRFRRGEISEALRKNDEALADFTACIDLDPKYADAYNHRGSVQFCRGKVAEALADFDTFLKLKPAAAPEHWKRGIALYYLGKYDEGARQFNAYEKVSTDDVENAVWHFLCVARKDGVEKAREKMLKVGKDTRVPMTEIYDLFRGKAKPEAVLAAGEAGKVPEAERRERLFYTHLYLGLYYDIVGDRAKALEHMELAAGKHGQPHYMGDVARVHLDHLKKAGKPD
jgi:lipoprotein NlpI